MRKVFLFFALCMAATCLWAQQIPSGTLLPVMLNRTIDSDKAKPGQQIEATLKQEVPLPDGAKIKRESKVFGHVVAASGPSGGKKAKITVQFDKIEWDKDGVPISTGLRALASMQLVAQARNPVNTNAGPGTSVWDLNFSQVGGQIGYSGDKIVKAPNGQIVGRVVQPGQIIGVPMANPERGCVGPASGATEQAFWLFSTDACGLYDEKGLTYISGIGGQNAGQITLKSPKNFSVRGGSAWLLQVN